MRAGTPRRTIKPSNREEAVFDCTTQTEIDALADGILRTAELIREIRALADQN